MKKRKSKPSVRGVSKGTRDTVMLIKNPIWRALAKQDPISDDAQISIGLQLRKALHALTNGDGAFEHLKELMVAAYAGIGLVEEGYGAECIGDFNVGLQDLQACFLRVRGGQGYFLEQAEAQRVSDFLELHEQQIALADRAILAQAIVKSYERTSAAFMQLMAVDQ